MLSAPLKLTLVSPITTLPGGYHEVVGGYSTSQGGKLRHRDGE